jgi:hypothetical protein
VFSRSPGRSGGRRIDGLLGGSGAVLEQALAHPDVLAGYGIGSRLEFLCLYVASPGAGRLLWPVIAALIRVLLIVLGCVVLSRRLDVRPEHYFWLIAAGMAVHALVSGTAIRLGAWTRGPVR